VHAAAVVYLGHYNTQSADQPQATASVMLISLFQHEHYLLFWLSISRN
jgi:hypothetical protein